jgi:hypothetical protein
MTRGSRKRCEVAEMALARPADPDQPVSRHFRAFARDHTALYIADQATLRSVVWSLGVIVVIWLFVVGVCE